VRWKRRSAAHTKERKHREIDPTLEILRECVAELDDPAVGDAYARERLRDMASTATCEHLMCQRGPGAVALM
jgi:DNA-binding transcriptional regulator GbsR (MarR family)